MPCFMTGSAEGDARLAADEARKEATKLAQLLCKLCEAIEHEGVSQVLHKNSDISKWWMAHQIIDAKRRAQEAEAKTKKEVGKKALSKLSPSEREALGL